MSTYFYVLTMLSFNLYSQVHKDYDCMLNQTNINQNNNKYFVIQLLTGGAKYHVFTRWGRVVSSKMHLLRDHVNSCVLKFNRTLFVLPV